MFSSQNQNTSQPSQLKIKQNEFYKQSAKKDRQNIMQSQRYFNSAQTLDWRMNIIFFKNKVQSVYNYFTLLNTLFQISQQNNWRTYTPQMEILLCAFHNIMYQKKGANIQYILKIQNFEHKLTKMFFLKDQSLYKHMTLFLKMLLAFNLKYMFLSQEHFSEVLAQSATYNDLDIVSEVLWILAQIKVSTGALIKLFKQQNLSAAIQLNLNCLLPLLTILANFMAYRDQKYQIVEQLVSSNIFQLSLHLGLASNAPQISIQAVLLLNNSLCFSNQIRKKLINDKQIWNSVLKLNSAETKQLGNILNFYGISEQQIYSNMKSMSSNETTNGSNMNSSCETILG